MIKVLKDEKEFPFSKGILARSINRSGLSLKESYEIVEKILDDLEGEHVREITSEEVKRRVSKELLSRGRVDEERFYRVRREMKNLDAPVFVTIGGGPGVGKSTIAMEIGHRLGINRLIGTDTIREIMRSILSPTLVPTLHESTFLARHKLKTSYISNKLIHSFEEQVSLVNEGLAAVVKRGMKEGLDMIIEGVHVVPGYLERSLDEAPETLFQYVIDVPDKDQHIKNFYTREEGSLRDPSKYIDEIDSIREIQSYILEMAKKTDVKVVENTDYEKTLNTILEDILSTLEKEI